MDYDFGLHCMSSSRITYAPTCLTFILLYTVLLFCCSSFSCTTSQHLLSNNIIIIDHPSIIHAFIPLAYSMSSPHQHSIQLVFIIALIIQYIYTPIYMQSSITLPAYTSCSASLAHLSALSPPCLSPFPPPYLLLPPSLVIM